MDQSALSTLFARYQQPLRRRLRWIVSTSEANIEDAYALAWLQLVSYHPDLEDPLTWLTTVAVREAVKLERRSRRTRPLIRSDTGQELALVDRRLELELREELLDTAATLTAAGLSERQRRILGLLIAGYSYAEISIRTGDSLRTVERQLQKARAAMRDSRGGVRTRQSRLCRSEMMLARYQGQAAAFLGATRYRLVPGASRPPPRRDGM